MHKALNLHEITHEENEQKRECSKTTFLIAL